MFENLNIESERTTYSVLHFLMFDIFYFENDLNEIKLRQ